MKHYTHIYLAAKAIDLLYQCVDNYYDASGNLIKGSKKSKKRKDCAKQQRIFKYYEDMTYEASWAPDDILKDNAPNHIFKLFTDEEFPNHELGARPSFNGNGVKFYNFNGALPYRVDHLAKVIVDLSKLRDFNDQFTLKQIVYLYLLLSHYIADAYVPMHCDLRDDPPSGRNNYPSKSSKSGKPQGKYMKSSAHGYVEGLWEGAALEIIKQEGMLDVSRIHKGNPEPELVGKTKIGLSDCAKDCEIKVVEIPSNGLMDYMIDVCIESKKRGQRLFPVIDPENMNEAIFNDISREIFTGCVSSLLSVWRHIWEATFS